MKKTLLISLALTAVCLSQTRTVSPSGAGLAPGTNGDFMTALGGSTVGQNMFTMSDPSAITFLRINADNSTDALTAAEFKTAIGAGSSEFSTSAELSAMLSDETGSGLAVFGTSPTLTSPTINLTSDAEGDIYYRNSGGAFTRLGIGADDDVLTVASGVPTWAAGGGGGGLSFITETENVLAPNTVNGVIGLSADSSLANTSIAFLTEGLGGLYADIPDGTAVGGNVRGDNAIDFQHKRTAADQVASGDNSVLVGGANNMASENYSIVVGGVLNDATSYDYSIVVGGYSNEATGAYSIVVGGNNSATAGTAAFIGGGKDHTMNAASNYSTISGGDNNNITNQYATIGGGRNHNATGLYSAISGGFGNLTSGSNSTVGGGESNDATGSYSVVGGGALNLAGGTQSTVVGGSRNEVTGLNSTSLGGTRGTDRGIGGSLVYSADEQNNDGDAQIVTYVMRYRTSGDVTGDLTTNDSGTATATNSVILPNNFVYAFSGNIVARSSGGYVKAWKIDGAIRRNASAATTAFLGTPTMTVLGEDVEATTWTVDLVADTTLGGMVIEITGSAGLYINWVGKIETTQGG